MTNDDNKPAIGYVGSEGYAQLTAQSHNWAQYVGNPHANTLTFAANKTYLTITPEGKLIPGEGLSTDEVTQGLIESMQHCFSDKLRENINKEMSDEIERLREKCDKQAMILRRLFPEKYPDTLFISGVLGNKDQNNMPERLLVCPAFGVDFSYVYEYTGKTIGGMGG